MANECFVAIATLTLVFGTSDAVCPTKDALLVYTSQCQSKARFVDGRTTTLGTEIGQATDACKNDAYKDALICVKWIYDECRSTPDVKELMEKLYSFNRLYKAYEYVCSHLNVMLDNEHCIANAEREARPCMKDESSRTRLEIKERTLSGEITDDIDTQLPYICQIQDGFAECLNKAYADKDCADAVKAMRENVRTIVLFALCTKTRALASSSAKSRSSDTVLPAIILSIFMKIKLQNLKM